MTHAKGLIRDDGRHKRERFAVLRGRLGATPRGYADLTQFAPAILDQNWVGSCVMNGVPCAAATTLAAAGTPLGFTPSVRDGYRMALASDRAQDYPLTPVLQLPPLVDRGTQILTGTTVMSRWGVTAMGPNVVVGGRMRNNDCDPHNACGEPDLPTIIKAGRKLIVGAYELDLGMAVERETQLALDAGHAVAIGGWVDTRTFEPYRAWHLPIGAQDFNDPNGGGHCTYIVGYLTDPAGVTLYRLRNSWGEEWGDEGCAWVTGAFLRQMWEAFALDVRVKA